VAKTFPPDCPTPPQIAKARKLIDHGERAEDIAALWNVGRTTLDRALEP